MAIIDLHRMFFIHALMAILKRDDGGIRAVIEFEL